MSYGNNIINLNSSSTNRGNDTRIFNYTYKGRPMSVEISYRTLVAYLMYADKFVRNFGSVATKETILNALLKGHSNGNYKRTWCLDQLKGEMLNIGQIQRDLLLVYLEDLKTYEYTHFASTYFDIYKGMIRKHFISNEYCRELIRECKLVSTEDGYYLKSSCVKLYNGNQEDDYHLVPLSSTHTYNLGKQSWALTDNYVFYKDGFACKKDITKVGKTYKFLKPCVLSYHQFNWDNAKHYYKGKNDKSIKMGIEIETYGDEDNSKYVNQYDNYFHCEHDCSLASGYSFEIISNPMTFNYWKSVRKTLIEPMFTQLKNNGQSNGNDGYGLHVHVNKANFKDFDSVLYFIHNVQLYARDIERIARRDSSDYYSYHKGNGVYSVEEMKAKPEILYDHFSSHGTCVNTHCGYMEDEDDVARFMRREGTIEIRVFKSTLNSDTLYSTLQFVNNLVKVSNKHSSNRKELFNGLEDYAVSCGVAL